MEKIKEDLKDKLYKAYLDGSSLNNISEQFNVKYQTLVKIIKIKKMSKNELEDYKIKRKIICKKYRDENKQKQKEYYLSTVKLKNNTEEAKEKAKKKAIERRKNSPEHCKQVYKNWYIKNKEKILKKKSINRKTEKFREKNRIKENQRYKTDISFRFKKILRNAIRSALNGKKKHKKTLELLGCNIAEFKMHIESQFKIGMNWDNYGFGTTDKWSLDHIKPLSIFDLTDEKQLEIACHYTNFQPMWCSDNFSKGDRYVG